MNDREEIEEKFQICKEELIDQEKVFRYEELSMNFDESENEEHTELNTANKTAIVYDHSNFLSFFHKDDLPSDRRQETIEDNKENFHKTIDSCMTLNMSTLDSLMVKKENHEYKDIEYTIVNNKTLNENEQSIMENSNDTSGLRRSKRVRYEKNQKPVYSYERINDFKGKPVIVKQVTGVEEKKNSWLEFIQETEAKRTKKNRK